MNCEVARWKGRWSRLKRPRIAGGIGEYGCFVGAISVDYSINRVRNTNSQLVMIEIKELTIVIREICATVIC